MSYNYFNRYQPKVVRRVSEVRGMKTSESENGIAIPQDAQNVSFNESYKTQQITFQIQKTPVEVQNFYKTIFLEKGWKIESEVEANDFFVTKYKMDNSSAMVMSSYQGVDSLTIASVEMKTE